MPYQSILETEIKGVFKIQPKAFGDERGWYCPTLEVSELESALGIKLRLTQIATTFNTKANILRGLHYQKTPDTQGKLVYVIRGSVLDVALDIRKASPTFGKFVTEIITASDHNQLWIPPGCAHGYLVKEKDTLFSYVVTDGRYTPASERGVNAFDPQLNIPWGVDRQLMDLKERDLAFKNLKDILPDDFL